MESVKPQSQFSTLDAIRKDGSLARVSALKDGKGTVWHEQMALHVPTSVAIVNFPASVSMGAKTQLPKTAAVPVPFRPEMCSWISIRFGSTD